MTVRACGCQGDHTLCVCVYACMYVYFMYVCMYVCMNVCMYVCMYVCMCWVGSDWRGKEMNVCLPTCELIFNIYLLSTVPYLIVLRAGSIFGPVHSFEGREYLWACL